MLVFCRIKKGEVWRQDYLRWFGKIIQTSQSVDIKLDKIRHSREESLTWQMPAEGQIIRHASKTALIWRANMGSKSRFPRLETEPGGGGWTYKVHLNKANNSAAKSSLTTSLKTHSGYSKRQQRWLTSEHQWATADRSAPVHVTSTGDTRSPCRNNE